MPLEQMLTNHDINKENRSIPLVLGRGIISRRNSSWLLPDSLRHDKEGREAQSNLQDFITIAYLSKA